MYVPQLNNQRQVPVRLSSVNFEGVFTSSRLNMESLISQNLYNNNVQPTNTVSSNNIVQPNRPNMNPNLQANFKGTPQPPSNNMGKK
jgi:hypothetical protein